MSFALDSVKGRVEMTEQFTIRHEIFDLSGAADIRYQGGTIARIDVESVTRLATLPSREVLLAQALGAITAPMSMTAGLFDAPLRDVAGLVQALADKRGEAAA